MIVHDLNNLPVVTDREHWPYGSSVLDRLMECNGCVQEAAKWPPKPTNPAAIDGTHTHTALEVALTHNIRDADLLRGSYMIDHEGVFQMDSGRAERIQVALNYVWPRVDAGAQLHPERFFDVGKKYDIEGMGGTGDITLIYPNDDLIEVIDYKDGGKKVSPETWQTFMLGIGAINELAPRVRNLKSTIVQPKIYPEPVSETYSPMEVNVKRQVLIDTVRKGQASGAPLSAGSHCHWCAGAAVGRCPEFNKKGQEAIDAIYQDLPAVLNTGSSPSVPQSPAVPFSLPKIGKDVPTEVLSKILDSKAVVLQIIAECEQEALQRHLAGDKLPGYKSIKETKKETLRSDAIGIFKDLGLPVSMYIKEAKKTPNQIRSSAEFKALIPPTQAAVEAQIYRPEGEYKLVPDTKPGVSASALADKLFGDLPPPPPTF